MKLVRCKEGEELYDLTISSRYEVIEFEDDLVRVIDDIGEYNILYDCEWEPVEDDETEAQ